MTEAAAAQGASSGRRLLLPGLLFVFVAALLPFVGTFFQHYPDERNYTNAAIMMLQSGDYWTPRWPDGRSNLHKPIVAYWVVAASYKLFGITLPASRLPFVLAGALVVAGAYATALALTGRHDTALLTAVITASEHQLILSSMRAIPDVLLCLFMLLSAYGFLGLIVLGRRTAATYWSAYLGAALAIETKGLLALVFVVFAWLFAMLDRGALPVRYRVRALVHAPSMLVSLVVATSWYVAMYALHRDRLVKIFFGDQIGYNLELADGTPLLRIPAYLGYHLINLLPWTLLLIPLAIWNRQSFRAGDDSWRRTRRFVLVWAVLMAATFGLGNKIEPRYLLPAGPLLAILLTGQLMRADPRVTGLSLRYLFTGVLVFLGCLGVFLAVLNALVIGTVPALLTLAVFAAVVAILAVATRGDALPASVSVALSMVLAFSLTAITLGPALDQDAGVNALARELELTQRDGAAPVLLTGPEYLANKLRVATGGRIAIDSWSRLESARDSWPPRMILPAAQAATVDLTGYRVREVATDVHKVPVDDLLRAMVSGRVRELFDVLRERYVIAIRR